MKRRACFFLILVLGALASLGADPVDTTTAAFDLGYPTDAEESSYRLNRYLFLFYVYMDVFNTFGLVDQLSTADKIRVVSVIERLLSLDYPVGFSVREYQDGQRLVCSFRLRQAEGKTMLFMMSNYNFKTNTIIPNMEGMADAYARLYYIEGDKLVNSHAVFDAKKEKEYLEDKENPTAAKNNLADMYLFDERSDNDSRVEAILLEAVKTAPDEKGRIVPKMTLAQYYLVFNQPEKARRLIVECAEILKRTKDEAGLSEFLTFMAEQLFMMENAGQP